MGPASDHIWRNGTCRSAYRGNALTIRPRIVIEHPKKIFSVHKNHQPKSLRLPDQRRYDGNVKMLTEATTEIPERQCLAGVVIRVRNCALNFILNFILNAVLNVGLVGIPALAQSGNRTEIQTQSQSQTRQHLLQDLNAGQIQEAILLGQRAVSRWPRDAELRHYLGVAYFKTGDSKQAREQLARPLELTPTDSAIHFDLALVSLSEQAYASAAADLQIVISLDPSNPLAHMLLGRAYLNSNRSLQAIDEFKTTLKLDPAIKLGHYHLGFAYFSLGRNDEAIAEYKEELRRSGENPTVLYELGRSLLETGKYHEAAKSLQ